MPFFLILCAPSLCLFITLLVHFHDVLCKCVYVYVFCVCYIQVIQTWNLSRMHGYYLCKISSVKFCYHTLYCHKFNSCRNIVAFWDPNGGKQGGNWCTLWETRATCFFSSLIYFSLYGFINKKSHNLLFESKLYFLKLLSHYASKHPVILIQGAARTR